jgi:hypothetical protein
MLDNGEPAVRTDVRTSVRSLSVGVRDSDSHRRAVRHRAVYAHRRERRGHPHSAVERGASSAQEEEHTDH